MGIGALRAFEPAEIGPPELVQIAGLVRFSYPAEGGFQKEDLNLYSEARMRERFRYFEALCLHSLCAQTDKDFALGVLIGEGMPVALINKLEQLLKKLPQARLIRLPRLPHSVAIRAAFQELFDKDAGFHLSFRLDDDDAVATDFIENVRAKLPQLILMSGGLDPVGLSFLKGLTLCGPKHKRRLLLRVDARPLGLGLCVLAPPQRKLNAFAFQHQNIQMNMPVIMDPYPLMNLRSFHKSNDSRQWLPKGVRVGLDRDALFTLVRTRFSLDAESVLAL